MLNAVIDYINEALQNKTVWKTLSGSRDTNNLALTENLCL